MNSFRLIFIGILFVFGIAYAEQSVNHPKYLYKVLSPENWEKSRKSECLILSDDDKEFIHLSTAEQLDRIISKYWAGKDHVVLEITTDQLKGHLVLEANPGGTNQYYHLYNGSIPLTAAKIAK